MSLKNLFEIKYRLLTIQETYGRNVSPNYYLGMPPEYFIDAEIDFYLDGKKFFSDNSFCIYKFVLDTSYWFRELFPSSEFIWNEDRFDGWLGTIAIKPHGDLTHFKVCFNNEEDKKDTIEVYIPTKTFGSGFTKFIDGFKAEAESFWGMSFNLP